jgi:hypothetical protein
MKHWVYVVIAFGWIGPVWGGPFDNAVGTWQGQAEYLAKTKAVVDPSAHAVVELTIRIESGGKISGFSPENGCQFLGLVKPGVNAQSHSVQGYVSECGAGNLNGRYTGTATVRPQQPGSLVLSLHMLETNMLRGSSRSGVITATMVRR